MSNTTSPLHGDMDSSGSARLLAIAGFTGLVTGLSIELYRLITLDPVLGTGTAPEWVEPARLLFIVGALIVLVYASVLDGLFTHSRAIVAGCALAGLWGVPLALLLDARISTISSPFGFVALVCSALFVVAAIAVGGAFLRQQLRDSE